jgi:hypothetical protein
MFTICNPLSSALKGQSSRCSSAERTRIRSRWDLSISWQPSSKKARIAGSMGWSSWFDGLVTTKDSHVCGQASWLSSRAQDARIFLTQRTQVVTENLFQDFPRHFPNRDWFPLRFLVSETSHTSVYLLCVSCHVIYSIPLWSSSLHWWARERPWEPVSERKTILAMGASEREEDHWSQRERKTISISFQRKEIIHK